MTSACLASKSCTELGPAQPQLVSDKLTQQSCIKYESYIYYTYYMYYQVSYFPPKNQSYINYISYIYYCAFRFFPQKTMTKCFKRNLHVLLGPLIFSDYFFIAILHKLHVLHILLGLIFF